MRFQRKITFILLVGYFVIAAALGTFSVYQYQVSEARLRASGAEMLSGYVEDLEELIRLSNQNLTQIVLNADATQALRTARKDYIRLGAMHELQNMMRNQITLQPLIAGYVMLYSGSNIAHVFQNDVSFDDKSFLWNEVAENDTAVTQFEAVQAVKKPYLRKTLRDGGVSLTVFLDYPSIADRTATDSEQRGTGTTQMMFFAEGKAFLGKEIAEAYQLQEIRRAEDVPQHVGHALVFAEDVEGSNVTAVLVMTGGGAFSNLTMILILLILLLVVGLFLVSYLLIRRDFVKPLGKISGTIGQIEGGDVTVRMDEAMPLTEYREIASEFNQMMDQISELRIQAYEKEISEQKSKLQYLQLQIRPHFFLNCLKTYYALAQQKKYEKLEEMIIETSRYFRYIFRNNFDEVTLGEELDFTGDYVNLQRNTKSIPIEYTCTVKDDALRDAPGIPLMIQTFVENSIHYAEPDRILKIDVTVDALQDEQNTYLNIQVKDNGAGYSPEWLKKINQGEKASEDGYHVGVYNLKRRLELKYGTDAGLFVHNRDGAVSEILYPIPKKSEKEQEE